MELDARVTHSRTKEEWCYITMQQTALELQRQYGGGGCGSGCGQCCTTRSSSLALGELDPGALNVHRQVATAPEPVSEDIFTNVVKGH